MPDRRSPLVSDPGPSSGTPQAEVYGADVSRQTISTITDKVIEGMAEWQNRPLDPVYPVIFIDAINVKIRDGKVANRPDLRRARGHLRRAPRHPRAVGRRPLGGRGGRQVLAARAHRDQEPRRGRRAHDRLRRADRPARRDHARSGRRRSRRPAWCTCCATASATPAASTATRSPRRCARSTPRRPRRRRWSGSWSSPRPGASATRRSCGCGRTPGRSSCRSWPSTPRSAGSICTTNAIESVNARIRRAVKARGHFPNEQAALKCVYMAIMSLDPTGDRATALDDALEARPQRLRHRLRRPPVRRPQLDPTTSYTIILTGPMRAPGIVVGGVHGKLWVPGTLRTSCDLLILVNQPAKPVASSDVADLGCGAAAAVPPG